MVFNSGIKDRKRDRIAQAHRRIVFLTGGGAKISMKVLLSDILKGEGGIFTIQDRENNNMRLRGGGLSPNQKETSESWKHVTTSCRRERKRVRGRGGARPTG